VTPTAPAAATATTATRTRRVSRRHFLLGTAALAAAPAVGCAPSRPVTPGDQPSYYEAGTLGVGRRIDADVCVYGATAGGVAAAVTAARLGHRTVLVAFGNHIGGMTTSGISTADIGAVRTVGGVAAEVYRRIGQSYGLRTPVYDYEPHVAARVLGEMLGEARVTVLTGQPLAEVTRSGPTLISLHTEAGSTVTARQYIDASYEGDLLARAGASWTSGRESSGTWGEDLAGYQPAAPGTGFGRPVDAYLREGDGRSGLLTGVAAAPDRARGTADDDTMAYGFRLCLSEAADRVPFGRPDGYRSTDWDLAARAIAVDGWDLLDFRVALPGGKYDLNADGGVSTDAVGMSAAWARADYAARQTIYQHHLDYTRGLLWFAGHDPRVPPSIRAVVSRYGLAPDEWRATGGWPPELYVREARRLVNSDVATESTALGARPVADPVAFASYKIDCHPCQRVAVDGVATNEGVLSRAVDRPWGVSMGALLPRPAECANLTVSTCVASSHVAWSSLRMEPVFMMLGQAAATVAALAIAGRTTPHAVPYGIVASTLRRHDAYLGYAPTPSST
jgi:NADPH-dependent 2,4-dienoyl-CoA reductase/sulfur reductase-like enzyme